MLKQLIAFDTTSRNSNLALIQFIQNYLTSFQIISHLTYDETKQKANIFATIPGLNTNGGLILSGHTDVVPVDGQAWDTDPFKAIIKDDRIYGRGTADMKAFIAILLAMVPDFLKIKLTKPLHFAFSYDEEVGCLGARHLIADFKNKGILPSACIVGEPTKCEPIIAHKGIQVFRCKLHGRAMHSSLVPEGCNAVEFAAIFIHWLRDLAQNFKKDFNDPAFDVPYTTLTTNVIHGGTAGNIIPSFCEFLFEFRQLPTVSAEDIKRTIANYIHERLLPEMQKEFVDANIEWTELAKIPSFEAKINDRISQLAQNVTQSTLNKKVSYATEAGLFQEAGIPTIICGPGSIEEAHRPNEFVSIEQIQCYEKILYSLVTKYQ